MTTIKGLIGLLFSISLLSTASASTDIFKVAPYTLRHTNGHLILNFQLNTDRKLIIEDGQKISRSFEYKKGQHYQTELSGEECGEMKDIRIRDIEGEVLVFNKVFPRSICKEKSSQEEFAFGFISDTQQFTDRHSAISKVIAYHHSMEPLQFLINGGDIVQTGTNESEWIEYFKGGSAYLMDIPQIAAIGNHDYRSDDKANRVLPKYFQKYMRWEGAPTNGNLFFEMPGFQLVIWNSNTPEFTKDEEAVMWKWLEQKMAAAYKSKTPLILATHFPVYSSSTSKYVNPQIMKLKKFLVPLVEKYKVKLILSGHTHMFERSIKDGVNYLVAGPAGGRPSLPPVGNKYSVVLDPTALTFTKIKYAHKTLKVQTFNQDNILLDQFDVNL